jgi:hypothetical protein
MSNLKHSSAGKQSRQKKQLAALKKLFETRNVFSNAISELAELYHRDDDIEPLINAYDESELECLSEWLRDIAAASGPRREADDGELRESA